VEAACCLAEVWKAAEPDIAADALVACGGGEGCGLLAALRVPVGVNLHTIKLVND
jgi:hypothetical protein